MPDSILDMRFNQNPEDLVEDEHFLQPTSGKKICIRTQIATASAYRTERGRAFSFWRQPCQGIFLLDTSR